MSARRYTGSLTLRVSCIDSGGLARPALFRVSAAEGGKHLGATTVQAAPADASRCVDDSTLLDEIAHAGVSFMLDAGAVDESQVSSTDTGHEIRRSRKAGV